MQFNCTCTELHTTILGFTHIVSHYMFNIYVHINCFIVGTFNYVSFFLGQERFTTMTRVYYKRASACIIMFDVTQPQTFYSTIKWKKDLDAKCHLPNGNPIPCILAANKVMLEELSPLLLKYYYYY